MTYKEYCMQCEMVKQIARDICRGNKICTCTEKDGHCASIMAIAERLADQGYKPPQKKEGAE